MGLVKRVSKALDVTEQEANDIINEQVNIGRDMLNNDRLKLEDVEDLMMDMGIESDDLEEFLMRMI